MLRCRYRNGEPTRICLVPNMSSTVCQLVAARKCDNNSVGAKGSSLVKVCMSSGFCSAISLTAAYLRGSFLY